MFITDNQITFMIKVSFTCHIYYQFNHNQGHKQDLEAL